MRQEIKTRWTAALRSGDYLQGHGYLQNRVPGGPRRFCCLGVLCDLAVADGVEVSVYVPTTGAVMYGGTDTLLPQTVEEWAGLTDDQHRYGEAGGDVKIQLDADEDDVDTLASWNDGGASFDQIADWIDANL